MRTQAIGTGFEGLEDRLLLAGNVVSALTAGVLVLNGDALANQVQLTVASNGQLTATGLSGTTIDGLATKNFGVINTLTVNGGLENDTINLNATAASIVNDVTLNGEAGNDTISVTGRFGSDLIVTGGTELDTITVNKVTVGRDLNLDSDAGNDKVTVSGSTISRDALILTGDGNDTVQINGTSIHRDLNLTDTAGINRLNITKSSTRNDAILVLGTDNDNLIMNGFTAGVRTGATAQGTISIDFGEGRNTLSMTNVKSVGTGQSVGLGPVDGIQLTGGAGSDHFAIINSQSAGGITIDTGDGPNRVEMTRVTISGIGDLEIVTGTGEDSVKLNQLLVGGETRIDTGAARDIFQMYNSRFTGRFGGTTATVFGTLGAGDDIASLGGNFFATTGSVLSGGGDPLDSVNLGSNGPDNNFNVVGFPSMRFGRLTVPIR